MHRDDQTRLRHALDAAREIVALTDERQRAELAGLTFRARRTLDSQANSVIEREMDPPQR